MTGGGVRGRRRALTAAATACVLALASACIGLDFVEPDAQEGARFHAGLLLDPDASPRLQVQAGLVPPGDGVTLTPLPDSTLRVGALRLLPFYVSARSGYVWRDSLSAERPGSLLLEPPAVPGADAPPRIRIALWADVPADATPAWTPGGDLVLPLPEAPAYADLPDAWTWTLSVTGWAPEGARTQLVSLRSWAAPGDSLRVPAALLPPLQLDSLEARWRCTTHYATSAADSSYVAEVSVDQTLVWRVAVAPPAQSRLPASTGSPGGS